jgi:pyruvate/2-oxoacid:ferredoxin oxidoreductase beta subunit
MATALATGILGAAGATYVARKSVKTNSQHFNQRMQDAEKYGIHPLQAIGSAGTLQGTGGLNIGSMINQQRQAMKAQKSADKTREDIQQHDKDLINIKEAAEDRRETRRLEEAQRNREWRSSFPRAGHTIYNWFNPGEYDEAMYDEAYGPARRLDVQPRMGK